MDRSFALGALASSPPPLPVAARPSVDPRRDDAYVELDADDVDDIVALERASWPARLCASADTIRERFRRGHRMLGVIRERKLAAKIAFAYARFDPLDQDLFPATFHEFAMQPRMDGFNACFIYNLDVRPDRRAQGFAYVLIRRALQAAQQAGCVFGVADVRPSSYRGAQSSAEQVESQPEVRAALDAYVRSGVVPPIEVLCKDRTFALYHRLTGAPVWSIRPDFIPDDHASGGFRIIIARPLDEALARLGLGLGRGP
jgi:GNAT superfamily N-acetyltransferase